MHPLFFFFISPDPKDQVSLCHHFASVKVIILLVILELPLSVRGVGRRTQPIRKLLNELLITSALNPTCLLQSVLHPTCLLQVNVPDARVFSSMQNEKKYPWLYDSVVHQGYLFKFCELFCGHSSSSQEFVTVGINLGIVGRVDST
jgi:sorbitol-specific phosphotransferase system component IIC